jgi:enoyl-CoA hydratase/carnithine racemase
MMVKLTGLRQPVIARVHGIATAAGCQLVSMCDLAVAADTARFALPGVNVGVFCSTPAVGVARNIGRKRVMEMLLTGDPIDARTAQAWGLVNDVVPGAELDTAIARRCRTIVGKSPAIVALGKRAFYRQVDRPAGGRLLRHGGGHGRQTCLSLTPARASTHSSRNAPRSGPRRFSRAALSFHRAARIIARPWRTTPSCKPVG